MNRHQMRIKNMITIYQHLLTGADIFELLNNNIKGEIEPFMELIITNVYLEKKEYSAILDKLLNDWTFDRLGFIEQAILLMSISEIKQEINEKAVVINEAVTLSKKYGSDDDSYKLINATLDRYE